MEGRLCDNCRQIDFDITPDPNNHNYDFTKLSATPVDPKLENCSLCSLFIHHVLYPHGYRHTERGLQLYAERLSVVYGYDNFPRHLDGLAMYFATPPFIGRPEPVFSGYFVRLNTDRLSGSETQPGAIDYKVICEWLSLCSSTHCDCVNKHQSLDFHDIPGFRLIDCSTGTIIPAVQATEREYVTLSYVWGSSSNKSSPAATSWLPGSLPLVVEDAMKVIVGLGYRYIWIDRYCIAQDDPTIHDQIRSMNNIYSRSALTIVAAAGNDAEYGLPGVSSRTRSRQFIATCNEGRTKLTTVRPAEDEILRSKWGSRGWTFQEAVMAKRCLAFTNCNVFFQCQNTHTSDDWKLPPNTFGVPEKVYASGYPFHLLKRSKSYQDAWAAIGQYLRDLTYDSDALNAISGVLNSFPSGQVRFLYGLPISNTSDCSSHLTRADLTDLLDPSFAGLTRNDFYLPGDANMAVLVSALLWMSTWCIHTSKPHTECVRRKEFPSWTWAGWKTTEEWLTLFDVDTVNGPRLSDIDQSIRSTINITFGDSVLNWSDAREKILDLSDQGMIPSIMTIVGKVFDVKIRRCEDVRLRTVGFPWLIIWPPFLEAVVDQHPYKGPDTVHGAIYPPPHIFEEEPGQTQDLIALLLTVGKSSDDLRCKFLLLRPVEEGVNGPVYERVTSCMVTINKGKFMEWKKEQQSEAPLIQLRTMKVAIR
ncbi:heterokaryon incompatibility protein-domain-containing protein [Pseudoneurospora amorphoporcata]|uniref:Heterokaryon incompatibility protein-domain-containing protein n=1 Tax=Pseudoneurospora amorphoporcata TaxID=241081 RepID=A0AAN6SCH3_9PEZI|nr:heterokaryon incompatibility protein-domain-containing protein [Pseudoneurospora amorphoporcata]